MVLRLGLFSWKLTEGKNFKQLTSNIMVMLNRCNRQVTIGTGRKQYPTVHYVSYSDTQLALLYPPNQNPEFTMYVTLIARQNDSCSCFGGLREMKGLFHCHFDNVAKHKREATTGFFEAPSPLPKMQSLLAGCFAFTPTPSTSSVYF